MKRTKLTVILAVIFTLSCNINAQLRDGLVAYWPLDSISKGTTPDVVSGYDMELTNLDDSNVVKGKFGSAFSFSRGDQTILTRAHEEGEDLPINQHESFTISFWAKIQGNGQNDLRVFSESNIDGNGTPLFNLGTKNNGSDGTVDVYIRGIGPTVGHIFTEAEPFDDEWSHVVFVQDNLERKMYVDGELDGLVIASKPEGDWALNATSIGGIIRANASHWVTGLIDEVALWKRALNESEVSDLYSISKSVVQPGDLVIASSANSPGAERVANAIDGNPTTKYLNFDGKNSQPSGFIVTPSIGKTLVTGLSMQTANDAPDRDVKVVTLEGSNDTEVTAWDSGNWELITELQDIPAIRDRFSTQTFSFENKKGYLHYRWTVFDTQGPSGCCMQISEVEFLGKFYTGPSYITHPKVTGFSSNPGGFNITLTDAKGNGVDLDSVEVSFDGKSIDAVISKVDGETVITHMLDFPLSANSLHEVGLSYSDDEGNENSESFEFMVSNYQSIDPKSIVDDSVKGRRGFLVYSTQISGYQTGSSGLHGNNWANAEKQIRGGYLDPFTNEPFLNEVDPDAFEGWSHYPVIVEMVNQNLAAPIGAGNFNTSREDDGIPGIPGWGGSNDGIASEYLALLDLDRGVYTLGVNSDDGFSAAFCTNFNDLLSKQVGFFDGVRASSDTLFEFFIEKPGLYPFRVSWWSNDGDANIEIFSVIQGVGKTLINDPDVDGSIKAYAVKGIIPELSTKDRPTTGRTSVVSVFPDNGGKLTKTASQPGVIEVVVQNEDTFVKEDTIQLSLDGEEVNPSLEKVGDTVVITYESDSRFSSGTHTVSFSYEESNGADRVNEWSFDVSRLYSQGAKPGSAEGLTVFEYNEIPSGSVGDLLGNEKYPESPDVIEVAKYFEWPQTGTIKRKPRTNYRDDYGWLILGYIHPPKTGEYVFHLASDDNSELWLSTDESPANAVKIAQESNWQGVRAYSPTGAEQTSAPVALEKGNAYFVELVVKEGFGGENSAVAWRLADEKDLRTGALPIEGEYLSQWLIDVNGFEPSISVIRNSDGTVTLTFEGTLQTAPTAKGPWRDSKQKSPYKVKANKAVFFGRAKK